MAHYREVRRYDPGSFHGSAQSYAGQGMCSLCSGQSAAEYQGRAGVVLIAMCGTCLAQRDWLSYLMVLDRERREGLR